LDRANLATLVDDFRRHGSQTAIVRRHGLRREVASYAAVAEIAGRFAGELDARGIVKGDRVLIWGENSAAWIGAFFGCVLRGVVAVPIDVAGTASFAQRVADEVAPKLITGDRERMFGECVAFEDFASLPAGIGAMEGLSESDPVQIVFTSGTTGDPKGIVHTHGNILASLRPIEREIQKYLRYERIFHPLRFMHTLPLSHVFGQFMGIWIPALLAAEVHFETRLVPSELIATIHDERMSVLIAVPRVLEIFETYLRQRFSIDLEKAKGQSAWRRWWTFRNVHRAFGFKFWALICGGATLPESLERFWNGIGLVVIQGYGMTETAALVSLNHPFHPSQGSIGKVLPGREIRLGDDGEILVRGDTVSKSTWRNGKLETQASEWLSTGDLASVDDAGNLKFRGRKKEVIVNASGMNIYPDDLEAALLRQSEVKAAAVVEVDGEPFAALILRASGDAAAAEKAVRAANEGLAGYQQIRKWMIWPEPDLPRTSSGKVLRREIAAGVHGAKPSTLAGFIGRISGENAAQLSDTAVLSEHLDSLGRVELQSEIESKLGVEIDDAAYQQVQKLADLRGLLGGASKVRDENIYPMWPWSKWQTAIRQVFIELVMRPFVAVLGNPRIEGHAAAVKPVLIVSNHASAYDVPLILYALPGPVRRRVAVAMAGEMMMNFRKARGLGNWFLDLCGPAAYFLMTALFNVFPLPQLGNFRKSFAHAGHAMDAGFHVLVFPEGRRTPDGMMHAFQKGSGMLWKELQCEALPVYLGGMNTGKWFRSGSLVVRVGVPIPFPAEMDAAEATKVLEEAVRKLEIVDNE
jgi:long-chain acyl-CoA synthetase